MDAVLSDPAFGLYTRLDDQKQEWLDVQCVYTNESLGVKAILYLELRTVQPHCRPMCQTKLTNVKASHKDEDDSKKITLFPVHIEFKYWKDDRCSCFLDNDKGAIMRFHNTSEGMCGKEFCQRRVQKLLEADKTSIDVTCNRCREKFDCLAEAERKGQTKTIEPQSQVLARHATLHEKIIDHGQMAKASLKDPATMHIEGPEIKQTRVKEEEKVIKLPSLGAEMGTINRTASSTQEYKEITLPSLGAEMGIINRTASSTREYNDVRHASSEQDSAKIVPNCTKLDLPSSCVIHMNNFDKFAADINACKGHLLVVELRAKEGQSQRMDGLLAALDDDPVLPASRLMPGAGMLGFAGLAANRARSQRGGTQYNMAHYIGLWIHNLETQDRAEFLQKLTIKWMGQRHDMEVQVAHSDYYLDVDILGILRPWTLISQNVPQLVVHKFQGLRSITLKPRALSTGTFVEVAVTYWRLYEGMSYVWGGLKAMAHAAMRRGTEPKQTNQDLMVEAFSRNFLKDCTHDSAFWVPPARPRLSRSDSSRSDTWDDFHEERQRLDPESMNNDDHHATSREVEHSDTGNGNGEAEKVENDGDFPQYVEDFTGHVHGFVGGDKF